MPAQIQNNGGNQFDILIGGVVVATIDGTGLSGLKDATVTPAKLSTAATPVGVGQTWQNVLASRAFDITYTNSSGRTMCVHAVGVVGSGTQPLTLTTGGMSIRGTAATVTNHAAVTVLIPAGGTYNIASSGMSSLLSWHELR